MKRPDAEDSSKTMITGRYVFNFLLLVGIIILLAVTAKAATIDIPIQVVVTGNNATIKITNGTSYSYACPGDITANQVLQYSTDNTIAEGVVGSCGNLTTDFIRNETITIANQTDDACRRQANTLLSLIDTATAACRQAMDKQDLTSIAKSLAECQNQVQTTKDSKYVNYIIAAGAGAIITWFIISNRQGAKDDIVR